MEVFIYLDKIYSDVVPLNFITKLLLFVSKMKECLPLINANGELSTPVHISFCFVTAINQQQLRYC